MIERRKCGPRARWPLLAALLLPCGCGSSADDLPSDPGETGTPTDPFGDSGATLVRFLGGEGDLTLTAGAEQELSLEVLPLGKHTIRLSLVGNAGQAFLSDGIIYTDDDGVAPPVTLTVLEGNTEFTVRAAAGRVEAELRVVTLPADTGTLLIAPQYAGNREIEQWVASVHVDTSCDELEGSPPPDGDIVVESAPGRPIRLSNVPAGRRLAVVVRSEGVVAGCNDAAPIAAGAEANVTLEVIDRPMQVDSLALDVNFGLFLTSDALPAFEELIYRAVSPMVAGASNDLTAVLNAMGDAASSPQAFNNARVANDWTGVLLANMNSTLAGNGLRTLSRTWMQSGLNRLAPSDSFRGTLSSEDGTTGTLTIASVAGLDPEEAGFEADHPTSIDTETNDIVRIGTTLLWRPSPLLSNLAKLEAVVQFPEATTAAQALAQAFDCSNVGSALVAANGSAPEGQSFAGCDLECTVDLCSQAMVTLWSRVDGSDLPMIPWDISAAARAELDDQAHPESLDGGWAGSLPVQDFGTAPMTGDFGAISPAN
jgi:hypothetical protein